LAHGETPNAAAWTFGYLRQKTIRSTRAEPLIGPLRQRHPAPLFKCRKEVRKGGVGEGVALEVESKSSGETVAPKTGTKLLEDRTPLPIRDPIKVEEGLIRIEHRPRDWMRGWRVNLREAPTPSGAR